MNIFDWQSLIALSEVIASLYFVLDYAAENYNSEKRSERTMNITHTKDQHDPWGIKVRALTALMAVLLTFLTIVTHRTQSLTTKLQKDVATLWSQYQSKRIRDYQLDLNTELMQIIAPTNKAAIAAMEQFNRQRNVYQQELSTLASNAREKEAQADKVHNQALWLEDSIGIVEVSLVLCSLYFIASKRIFPLFGVLMAVLGMGIAMLSCFAG